MVVRMVDAMSSKHNQEGCWSSQTTAADVRFSRKTMPPLETHHIRQVLDSHQQRALIGNRPKATTGRIRKHTAEVREIQSWAGAVTSGEGNRSIVAGNTELGTGVGEGGGAKAAGSAPTGEGCQVGILLSDYRECALTARGGARVVQDAAESAKMVAEVNEGRRKKWPQPSQSLQNGCGGVVADACGGGGSGSGAPARGGEIGGGGPSCSPWEGGGGGGGGGGALADVLNVPREILELSSLKGVLSTEVWEKLLTERDRQYLARYLPAGVNSREAIGALLAGKNLHFGNQYLTWSAALRHRELQPEALEEKAMEKKRRRREFYSNLRRYHRAMVSDLREMAGMWKECRDPDQELQSRLRGWRQKKWEEGGGGRSDMAGGGGGGGGGGRAHQQQQTSQNQPRHPALPSPLSSSVRLQEQQGGSCARGGHGDDDGSGSRGGGGVGAGGGGGLADPGGRRSGGGGESGARRGASGGGGGSAESSGEQRFADDNWRIPKEAVAAANAAALAAYAEWNRKHGNSVSGPDPAEMTRVLRVNKQTMVEIAKRRETGEEVRWDALKRLMEKEGGGEGGGEVHEESRQQEREHQPREGKRRRRDGEREKSEKDRFAQEKKRQEDHWQMLVHQDLPASQVLFMKFHQEQIVIARWVAEQCAEKYNGGRFARRFGGARPLSALQAARRSVYL